MHQGQMSQLLCCRTSGSLCTSGTPGRRWRWHAGPFARGALRAPAPLFQTRGPDRLSGQPGARRETSGGLAAPPAPEEAVRPCDNSVGFGQRLLHEDQRLWLHTLSRVRPVSSSTSRGHAAPQLQGCPSYLIRVRRNGTCGRGAVHGLCDQAGQSRPSPYHCCPTFATPVC